MAYATDGDLSALRQEIQIELDRLKISIIGSINIINSSLQSISKVLEIEEKNLLGTGISPDTVGIISEAVVSIDTSSRDLYSILSGL